MRKWKAWLFALAVLIGIGTIGTVSVTAEAQNLNQGKRVLFISSYSYGWDTVQTQIEGIKAGVDENTTIDYEFMDTKRFRTDEWLNMFHDMLKYHLENTDPYDVVIVGDDAALQFAMEYREELFPEIPVVFEGVNDEEYAMKAAENPLVTGIIEKLSVEKNIDMALKVNPTADKVVAILDDSVTADAERKNFYSAEAEYPELEFSEINSSELTTAQLQQAISMVDDKTILIYIVMSKDGSGKQYTSDQALCMIVDYAKVPVYRMVEAGIGDGLLGGNVVSMYKSGEIAAQMAMDIANGTDSAEINVVKDSPNIYCVDEDVMRKFGLEASQFPKDTEFVNHRENFFVRNREALIPALILITALNVIICWVCFDNYRRRKLLQELEQARAIMEAAAQHDFLTGLPNRSKFMKDLEQMIDAKVPCTVMMLDIDNFKKINDTYGHTAGDEALQQVANLMIWLRRYMIDQMNSDYVKFARSGGLTEGEIFTKHILKNAAIPIVQGVPASVLFALTGAIITERVYVVPGAGNLLTEAISKYDNGVIVGVTLFYAVLSVISIILGDVLMSMVDPRISFSTKDR